MAIEDASQSVSDTVLGATVLVVEDEASVRQIIVRTLEINGLTVVATSSGEEALEFAMRPTSEFDVLLTDMVMPGMNGVEVAERILLRHPRVSVLYMSGYSSELMARTSRVPKGVEYIEKPFSPNELVRRIHRTLGR